MPDIFVRSSEPGFSDEPPRRFAPLPAAHPIVREGRICPGCDEPFKAGDSITLIAIGPGTDAEAREKARNGQFYAAVGLPIHWACATGDEL